MRVLPADLSQCEQYLIAAYSEKAVLLHAYSHANFWASEDEVAAAGEKIAEVVAHAKEAHPRIRPIFWSIGAATLN